jgi:hypothetical protein
VFLCQGQDDILFTDTVHHMSHGDILFTNTVLWMCPCQGPDNILLSDTVHCAYVRDWWHSLHWHCVLCLCQGLTTFCSLTLSTACAHTYIMICSWHCGYKRPGLVVNIISYVSNQLVTGHFHGHCKSEGAEGGKAAEPVCSPIFRDISQKTSSSTKILMKIFVIYIRIEELGEWRNNSLNGANWHFLLFKKYFEIFRGKMFIRRAFGTV